MPNAHANVFFVFDAAVPDLATLKAGVPAGAGVIDLHADEDGVRVPGNAVLSRDTLGIAKLGEGQDGTAKFKNTYMNGMVTACKDASWRETK